MLLVFARAGWGAAFVGLAAILLVTTVPVLVFREPPVAADVPRDISGLAAIRESLSRSGMAPWLVVLMTYKVGEWFATGMLRTFLTDARLGIDDIALMLGLVGFSAAVVGALAGGALTTKLGPPRALVVFGGLQTLAIASLAVAAQAPSMPMFYAVTIAEHLTSAMATAALFTAMMNRCRDTHAGTDYTVQASLVVITTGLISAVSGVSAQGLGYTGHFVAASLLSLIGVAVAMRGGRLSA
jgi:predicted MFS family arabinose efflux permease